MNPFVFRTAIDDAPKFENGAWTDLVDNAADAWAAGDWQRLEAVGRAALDRHPCWPWRRRIESLMDEIRAG